MRVTLGDRSSGGPGIPVQPYDEAHYAWKCYVDCQGNGNYLPLADRPSVRVVAAEPYRLRVLMPSGTVAGQPTSCLVRAEDRYGNPALRYRGTVTLRSTDPQARLPAAYTFTEADRGVHRFEAVVFQWLGNHTLGAADGRFQAVSNPVRVTRTRPDRLLLWGDLHGHTLFSDGRGTVEEYYDFAQRVAGLDFCAVTDHAFELLDEMWEHSKAVTNRYNQPGRFVTFQGYEWSGPTEVGGDHNVYFLDDDPPLYRSALMYDPRNLQMDHGPQPKVEHVEELLAKLAWRLGNKDVFCIPHFGGRRGNPKWHNEKVQRLIEIFSEHRRSEDWANTFLTRGHRLGIMASGDDHYGNPGYGYFRPSFRRPKKEIGMGCLAVYAAEHTRQSIFHALYDRHVYATSGDRIILDVHADGHPMGSEYRTTSPPVIHVEAAGTVRVARVEIKKNGKAVFTHQPGQIAVSLQWRDPDFQADRPCYYYVRILQDNNEEAISSPIWVN